MDLTELSFFELIDRAIRLRSHIEKCIRHSRLPTRRVTAETAASQDVKAAIDDIISKSINVYLGRDTSELKKKKLSHLMTNLVNVHRKLLQLVPRVPEPIELRSFLRQSMPNDDSDRGDVVQKRRNQKLPLVFGSENLGDQSYFGRLVHSVSELSEEGIQTVDAAVSDAAVAAFARENLSTTLALDFSKHKSDTGYITIGRVDVGSPIQWPALHHELGHRDVAVNGVDSLYEKFEQFVTGCGSKPEAFTQLSMQIGPLFSLDSTPQDLKRLILNWLLECWCDAYAVNTIGPAYLYSQLHSFIFSDPVYFSEQLKSDSRYPPAMVRIRLSTALSRARYELTGSDEKERVFGRFDTQLKAFSELYGAQEEFGSFDDAIVDIVNVFLPFLKSEFPPSGDRAQKSKISFADLQTLEWCLGKGYPIPSLISVDGSSEERATYPSEILITGWHYRNSALRETMGKIFKNCFDGDTSSQLNSPSSNSQFVLQVSILLDRFDESMKRSLQVSEWFGVLHEASSEQEPGVTKLKAASSRATSEGEGFKPGLLSDRDLLMVLVTKDEQLTETHRLRIIPLIDRKVQIIGSVIDLRLGHNFEFFFSNVTSDVDPVRDTSDDGASLLDSMEMEIDQGEGIRIAPGQFLLGHTLEYLKLPFDVAAQIEGRSSFARLGIQVHMTANLVEAGFEGCLTLEIANNGPATVKLYPGMRIAQLRFFRLASEPNEKYTGERKYRGLLSHNKTKQFSDKEVKVFRNMQPAERISVNDY